MVLFTWNDTGCALIGGTLIAISTTLHLLLAGRVTGNSGIFNSIIKLDKNTGLYWKLCFVFGLISIPVVLHFSGI